MGLTRLIIGVGVWLACAATNAQILVLGDSLSAGYGIDVKDGWVQLLEERLAADGYDIEVVNASVSGDTSRQGAARLPKLLNTYEPEVVILELGGNDGLRGQPLKLMRANLSQMIERAQSAGARVLLLGIQIPPNYGKRYTEAFASVYPELADEYNTAFVPFFLQDVALNDELMQDDDIHPNAKAQPQLLDNVWPHLKPLLDEGEDAKAAPDSQS